MNTTLPKSRALRKKAVAELLADPRWTKDEEWSRRIAPHAVYVHSDGRVLNVFSGDSHGRLYPSRKEFQLLLDNMEKNKAIGAQHILKGHLAYGKDFIKHVPELVDNLATLFNIPRSELDNSLESLYKLNPKVKRRGRKKSLEMPVFSALVAYIGEVMRRYTNGHWEMWLSWQDGETWEPWIVDPEGRACSPWDHLYDMLYEPSETISIGGAANVAINFRHKRILPQRPLPPGSTPTFTYNPEDSKS